MKRIGSILGMIMIKNVMFAKKSIDEQAMPFSVKKIKSHKAYGSLSKYANKKVANEERDIIAKAMVEKYVKNN